MSFSLYPGRRVNNVLYVNFNKFKCIIHYCSFLVSNVDEVMDAIYSNFSSPSNFYYEIFLYRSTRPIAQSALLGYRSFFAAILIWTFEETHTEELTEAIRCARLSCSKSLNDLIFIWFTDKKICSHYPRWKIHRMTDCTHLQQQKRMSSEQNFSSHKNWLQSVTDGVWRSIIVELRSLILVHLEVRVKVNDLLLSQQLLPALRQANSANRVPV